MPKKGSTAVKVTFMTMTLVTPVTAVKFDYGTVQYYHTRTVYKYILNEIWVYNILYTVSYIISFIQ